MVKHIEWINWALLQWVYKELGKLWRRTEEVGRWERGDGGENERNESRKES